ncbi:testis-specific gene A8 protein-like [Heteronotia binoei]|uniref:testis-specific gene A8 protein-like n=1 Tax=Heteronotia binoei TaxID=13085 RepID=UPI00292F9BC6|nr:testis-specific gene A8 protein-like [Heteronotia binoei]
MRPDRLGICSASWNAEPAAYWPPSRAATGRCRVRRAVSAGAAPGRGRSPEEGAQARGRPGCKSGRSRCSWGLTSRAGFLRIELLLPTSSFSQPAAPSPQPTEPARSEAQAPAPPARLVATEYPITPAERQASSAPLLAAPEAMGLEQAPAATPATADSGPQAVNTGAP